METTQSRRKPPLNPDRGSTRLKIQWFSGTPTYRIMQPDNPVKYQNGRLYPGFRHVPSSLGFDTKRIDTNNVYDVSATELRLMKKRAALRESLKKEWQMKVTNPYTTTQYVVRVSTRFEV